jgi:drug/metabolite transporter (DMT)-like permease
VTSNGKGAAMIVAAFLCLATEMMAIHAIGGRLGTLQIVFLRTVGNFVLIGAAALAARRLVIRSNNLKIQLIRGAFSAAGFWCFVFVFARLPLVDATALSYTRGGFMVIFALLALGETVFWTRWLGVAAGLVGAALIIRPAFSDPNIVYFLAIAAPALNAAAVVSTRFAVKLDSVDTTMFWLSLVNMLVALPALAMSWHFDTSIIPLIVLVMIMGPLGTYLSLWAVRFAEVSFLAPFDYTRLIVNTLAALVLFHEMPGLYGWLGMFVIVAGCLLSTPLPRPLSRAA